MRSDGASDLTIDRVRLLPADPDLFEQLRDYGSRRYHVFATEIDFRAANLAIEIRDEWDVRVQEQWRRTQAQVRESVFDEFGDQDRDRKLADFIAIGSKPMSIVAHHNDWLHDARRAFVLGSYYSALTAACALGEWILNNLVRELREQFPNAPKTDPSIYTRQSFSNWRLMIETLSAWDVLLPEAANAFSSLRLLRDRALHFDRHTPTQLRARALDALKLINQVVATQFSAFGGAPWFLTNTPGSAFIARNFEKDPFVRTYYLPQSAFVGPLFAMETSGGEWRYIDIHDYGSEPLTDEEFARRHRERQPHEVAGRPERSA